MFVTMIEVIFHAMAENLKYLSLQQTQTNLHRTLTNFFFFSVVDLEIQFHRSGVNLKYLHSGPVKCLCKMTLTLCVKISYNSGELTILKFVTQTKFHRILTNLKYLSVTQMEVKFHRITPIIQFLTLWQMKPYIHRIMTKSNFPDSSFLTITLERY